jgi:hypothetical protein
MINQTNKLLKYLLLLGSCTLAKFRRSGQSELFPADTRGLKPTDMEVCYWALLFTPLVILHHLLNVYVQLANKRGLKKKNNQTNNYGTCSALLWLGGGGGERETRVPKQSGQNNICIYNA